MNAIEVSNLTKSYTDFKLDNITMIVSIVTLLAMVCAVVLVYSGKGRKVVKS